MLNQEILIPAVVGASAFAIGFTRAGIKKLKFEAHKESLKDRVVKLSSKYRKENGIDDIYATIECVYSEDKKAQKIIAFQVVTLPSKATLKRKEAEYKEQFNKRVAQYKEAVKRYNDWMKEYQNAASSQLSQYYAQGYGGYYPRVPDEPVYDFDPEDYDYRDTLHVPRKAVEIMPPRFDYISGSVIKELKESKGGEKKVKKMPKIFRYSLYLAFVVLVWHVVMQIDGISGFVVHHIFNIK